MRTGWLTKLFFFRCVVFYSSYLPTTTSTRFIRYASRRDRFVSKRPIFNLNLRRKRGLRENRPISFLFVFNKVRITRRRLFRQYKLFGLPINLFRSNFIKVIRPMTFAFNCNVRNLYMRLPMISNSVNVSKTNSFSTSRATTATKIYRRIFLITNNCGKNMTSCFLSNNTMELTRIYRKFLRRVL